MTTATGWPQTTSHDMVSRLLVFSFFIIYSTNKQRSLRHLPQTQVPAQNMSAASAEKFSQDTFHLISINLKTQTNRHLTF